MAVQKVYSQTRAMECFCHDESESIFFISSFRSFSSTQRASKNKSFNTARRVTTCTGKASVGWLPLLFEDLPQCGLEFVNL